MNTVGQFRITADGALTLDFLPLEGQPVEKRRASLHEIPAGLQPVFDAAKAQNVDVRLVVCHVPGMRAAPDGSHQRHYLVPASENIPVVGTTL